MDADRPAVRGGEVRDEPAMTIRVCYLCDRCGYTSSAEWDAKRRKHLCWQCKTELDERAKKRMERGAK